MRYQSTPHPPNRFAGSLLSTISCSGRSLITATIERSSQQRENRFTPRYHRNSVPFVTNTGARFSIFGRRNNGWEREADCRLTSDTYKNKSFQRNVLPVNRCCEKCSTELGTSPHNATIESPVVRMKILAFRACRDPKETPRVILPPSALRTPSQTKRSNLLSEKVLFNEVSVNRSLDRRVRADFCDKLYDVRHRLRRDRATSNSIESLTALAPSNSTKEALLKKCYAGEQLL
jgi:hypothetical protein